MSQTPEAYIVSRSIVEFAAKGALFWIGTDAHPFHKWLMELLEAIEAGREIVCKDD